MLKSLSTSLIVRGILALAVGIMALAWPGVTVLALVILFAVYAFIAAGFRAGEPAGTRALFFLGGLASVAFGVALFAHPGMGAVALALLFGLFNLIYGTSVLAQGIELRRAPKTLRSVLREKTAV